MLTMAGRWCDESFLWSCLTGIYQLKGIISLFFRIGHMIARLVAKATIAVMSTIRTKVSGTAQLITLTASPQIYYPKEEHYSQH
jgi:hypothetical protein